MSLDEEYRKLGLSLLPIDDCLEEVVTTLAEKNAAVLVAPPGAGKTSRVPLALLNQPWNEGKKILVLEPRRLAARASAEHMASQLGEKPGETIGYRVRMDSRIGPKTRIEFVTEGVFTRMILDDPELIDVGCICFDEFHERNLEGDLSLALAIDVQASIRDDLRLLPMSATIDGAAVAQILNNTEIITSKGLSFPVEIRHMPRKVENSLEDAMASAIRQVVRNEEGSLLCFLPGQGEIMRTMERLTSLPENVEAHALYGTMKSEDQRAAIRPAAKGRRKVVLATSIAQTSLTLDEVTVVIDSGLARVPRHEPATGLNRLETVRASKATINQRAGRAGRTQAGTCIRLWHEGQTASLPDYEKPEILDAELSSLVLDLADWGITDPTTLSWLDQPPGPAWEIACKSLQAIHALDQEMRITQTGKVLRKMPLPPRLAHMVLKAGEFEQAETAACLALLITERGTGGRDIDLASRLENLVRKKNPVSKRLLASAASIARNTDALSIEVPSDDNGDIRDFAAPSVGAILSFAWSDRIARRMGPVMTRGGREGEMQYLLANGRRAILDGLSPLAREEWISICEIQGSAASARILSAAALSKDDIEQFHKAEITFSRELTLDEATGKFKAHSVTRLGKIVISRKADTLSPGDDIPSRILEHFRVTGLGQLLSEGPAASLRDRMAFLHANNPDQFKTVDDDALVGNLENWLLPMLGNATGLGDITPSTICEGLKLHIGYEHIADMDRLAPEKLTLPSGQSHRLEYTPEAVTIRAKVQEFYGLSAHPTICDGKVAVVLEFLSPAMRPIQKTLDIAGFWSGSWQDVRKEMRGRYPKHFWPENPAIEQATTRTKPRN